MPAFATDALPSLAAPSVVASASTAYSSSPPPSTPDALSPNRPPPLAVGDPSTSGASPHPSPDLSSGSEVPASNTPDTPGFALLPAAVPHTEVSRAPWYAPPALHARAHSLLHAFSVRNGGEEAEDEKRAAAAGTSGAAQERASASPRAAAAPAREADSGLRMYAEPALPPAYTPG